MSGTIQHAGIERRRFATYRARAVLLLFMSAIALGIGWHSIASRGAAPVRVARAKAAVDRAVIPSRQLDRDRKQAPGDTHESPTPRPRSMGGVVRDSQRNPIAGASVCGLGAELHCCTLDQCVLSDSAGKFELDGPARGLIASAAGYASRRLDISGSVEGLAHDIVLDGTSGATISGQVLDATGGPVVGALVTARPEEASPGVPLAITQSNASGEFRLDAAPGGTELNARLDAYSVAARWVHAPASGVSLVLAPSSSIRGHVVASADGAPVAGVQVSATGEGGLSLTPDAVETARDGSFVFDALPAGGYALAVSAPHWRSERSRVAVGVGEVTDGILLEVVRAASLQARVRVGGEPCREGSAGLSGPIKFVSNIRAGRFEADGLLPGSYEVSVYCSPGAPLREQLEVGDEVVHRDWELSAGLSLHGRVERADGRPFVGANVLINPISALDQPESLQPAQACATDGHGLFSSGGLLPGEYELSIPDDREGAAPGVRVTLAAGEAPDVVLRAPASGSIRAVLRRTVAQGMPDRAVFARREGTTLAVRAEPSDSAYLFQNLPLARYEVFVDQPNEAVHVALERDGQLADISLRDPGDAATAVISGYVTDEAGLRVVDAWVRAETADLFRSPTEASHPVLTDDRGEFTLTGLNPAKYTLYATNNRGETALQNVESGAHDVRLRLEAFGTLSGTLATPDGEGVAHALLFAHHERGQGLAAEVNAGRWTMPWAPPGHYELRTSSELGILSEKSLDLPAGGHLVVQLHLRAASVSNTERALEPPPAEPARQGR